MSAPHVAQQPTPERNRSRRGDRGTVGRVVLLALGLALVAGLVAAVIGRRVPEQAYTVAQVRAGLARQPAAWVGRTVLVRGVAVESSWVIGLTIGTSTSCIVRSSALGSSQSCPLAAPKPNRTTLYLTLVDDSVRLDQLDLMRPLLPVSQQANPPSLVLAVRPVTPNPLIALARRLPPFARFFPTQGRVPGGVPHLYRIRLQPRGSAPCANPFWFTCTDGVLVDAQP